MKSQLIVIVAVVLLVGCGEPSDFHKAAGAGNIEAVKQHLAAGTDVDVKDDEHGLTPLHVAAIEGHKAILKLLIAKGAEVNAKDKRGRTPLVYAKGEIANLLRKHGAK